MPVVVLLLMCLLAPPTAELERTDQLIQQITEMKNKVMALQAELDGLLRTLSEQRGSLQKAPQPFAYLAPEEEAAASKHVASVRCAASTSNGKRCTRPAESGSRYCWQHKLAHTR